MSTSDDPGYEYVYKYEFENENVGKARASATSRTRARAPRSLDYLEARLGCRGDPQAPRVSSPPPLRSVRPGRPPRVAIPQAPRSTATATMAESAPAGAP